MPAAELRARREACGLSQQALAECAGVCRATVNRWESGAWPVPQQAWDALESVEGRVAEDTGRLVLEGREWGGPGPFTVAYSPGPDSPANAAARLAWRQLRLDGVPVALEYTA